MQKNKKSLERIVHSKIFSDSSSISMVNTPVFAGIELLSGMSASDSATMRLLVSVTNPIAGMIRDYAKKKYHIDPKINKRKNIILDFSIGLGAAIAGFSVDLLKYSALNVFKGEEINRTALLASLGISVYTAVIGGDLMGMAIDTYRDGLGIESKEHSRSLFPADMPKSLKRNITYGLSAMTWAGIIGYYSMYR